MIAQKKKIIKESKSLSTKNNNYGHDKCPKNEKDCSKCKILDCPEEQ
jgi:hypothetical protein